MSANVDEMFSVRRQVWWQGTSEDHGQAHILGDHPSWEEARKLAGLSWDPKEERLHRPADVDYLRQEFTRILFDGEMSADAQLAQLMMTAVSAHQEIRGWKHVFRDDDEQTLACTQDSYSVISNSEFGQVFQAVMRQPNIKFETGGCLEGGKKVWMLALLDEPLMLRGDDRTVTYPMVALMSRHDAKGATTLRATNVRIVCSNTFNMAELGGDDRSYSFIHRGEWRSHVDDAREALSGVREDVRAYAALAEELLLVKVSENQAEQFITAFFPMPPRGVASDRVIGNVNDSRAAFRKLLVGATVGEMGVDGTAYGIVQAAGEYLDHIRASKSWETRLNRSLLSPEPLKKRALSIIREVCEIDLPVTAK